MNCATAYCCCWFAVGLGHARRRAACRAGRPALPLGVVPVRCCSQLALFPHRTPRSDFSANGRRNERFMLELSRAVQEGQLPEGECVEGYAAAGGGATIG